MNQNYFELFGLPEQYALDVKQLNAAWHQVSSKVHPDRYATALPSEKRIAIQWSGIINEAYDTLKSPLSRAVYLCERNGVSIDAENNTAMAPDFLMTQMQLREQIDEAQGDNEALKKILDEIVLMDQNFQRQMLDLIDSKKDWQQAANKAREWMFIVKIQKQISAQIK